MHIMNPTLFMYDERWPLLHVVTGLHASERRVQNLIIAKKIIYFHCLLKPTASLGIKTPYLVLIINLQTFLSLDILLNNIFHS